MLETNLLIGCKVWRQRVHHNLPFDNPHHVFPLSLPPSSIFFHLFLPVYCSVSLLTSLHFLSFTFNLTSPILPAFVPLFTSQYISNSFRILFTAFGYTNIVQHHPFLCPLLLTRPISPHHSFYPSLLLYPFILPWPFLLPPSLPFLPVSHSLPSCLCQCELPGIHLEEVLLSGLDNTSPTLSCFTHNTTPSQKSNFPKCQT